MAKTYLNTKEDFDYFAQQNQDNPEVVRQQYEDLLGTINAWYPVKELAEGEEGVVDETHKVETSEKQDTENPETKITVRTQCELRQNPTARLFLLGFTVEEVQAKIEQYSKK